MNTAKTPEQNEAYYKGYDSKFAEIIGMGWESARDKFNSDYPHNSRQCSMTAWHYAKGEIDALVNNKNKEA